MRVPDAYAAAVQVLRESARITCLSGAGFSTASGIPDFRSGGSGLWNQQDPMAVASLWAFQRRPERFYSWFRPLAGQIFHAHPNPAHTALARLEQTGRFDSVLTQNIDGLHQQAGSSQVLELHGSVSQLICPQCYRSFPSSAFIHAFLNEGVLPRCRFCSSILKPDAILFGEQLPAKIWENATLAARTSDLMIVAGTSLEVTPAADLPFSVLEGRGKLMMINEEPTHLDSAAAVLLRGDVAQILPEIVNLAFFGGQSPLKPR